MLNIGNMLIDSLDYICIVDRNYRIVYNTRYDERLNDNSVEYVSSVVVGKDFFDFYPNLDRKNSNVAHCLETGEITVLKHQRVTDCFGRDTCTNNVTFPLTLKGEIIAAVELSMDVTDPDADIGTEAADRIFDGFVQKLRKETDSITFNSILTVNKQMLESIERAKVLAALPNPTLIYGETGTGKELFAQAMISYCKVPKNKVVVQNCAAVPENLMESILFGTLKGSYTGAETRKGLFEEADGGVLFLDELNSMPYNLQSKLLRVLQEGTFMPVGGNKEKKVSVKVIGAMNIDPVEAMENNIIRRDLFYRFSGGIITLLPLRERKEDISLFTTYYLNHYTKLYNKPPMKMDEKVKELFYNYAWDGNVRELRNLVETMVISAQNREVIGIDLIPDYLRERMIKTAAMSAEVRQEEPAEIEFNFEAGDNIPYEETLEKLERKLILEALDRANGNKSKAARILGIPRQTLKYRLQKLDLL